jgi:hypothetical protein
MKIIDQVLFNRFSCEEGSFADEYNLYSIYTNIRGDSISVTNIEEIYTYGVRTVKVYFSDSSEREIFNISDIHLRLRKDVEEDKNKTV